MPARNPARSGGGFAAPMDIPLPEFDQEAEFVFSLEGGRCSVPCQTFSFGLSTSGCCLYGADFGFVSVGSGIVSVSPIAQSACDGQVLPWVNGNLFSAAVLDCDPVSISFTFPTSANGCCTCCVSASLAGTSLTTGPGFRMRNTVTGLSKAYLNKQAIIERLLKKKTKP